MSAVGARPEALGDLAARLLVQGRDHETLTWALVRAAVGSSAMPTLAATEAETQGVARGLAELAQSIASLARFVDEVVGALARADETLARVGREGGSGASPWTWLGAAGTSTSTRTYARGVRRVYENTLAGPLRADERTRRVTTGTPSVRDGFTRSNTTLSAWSLARQWQTGAGATQRWGGSAGYVEVGAFAGARSQAGAWAGVSDSRAQVGVSASAEFGASATVSAFAGSALLGLGGRAQVFTGARAAGEASLGIGLRGIDAGLNASALLGGSAEAAGEVDVLGVRTSGHVGVSYGLGGEIDAEASVGLDKIGVKLDLGATIGLGVSVGVDVSVDPSAIAGGVADAGKATVKAIKGWF